MQQAGSLVRDNRGHNGIGRSSLQLVGGVGEAHGEGEKVDLRPPVVELYLHQHHRRTGRTETRPIKDSGCLNMARFPREPTLFRKIFRKIVRFQALAIYSIKYAFPSPSRTQNGLFFEVHACLRRLGSLLKFEPKEAVRSQSQPIGLAPDRRKVHVTEHLDRYCTFGLRQIEIHRLSKTRKIRDTQNSFVLVLSQVSEHFTVCGLEKLDGPAPKDSKKFSQRNHVAHPI